MVIVAVLGVAFLALAIMSEVVFHASIDPTEDTFAVTLRNDTASAVVDANSRSGVADNRLVERPQVARLGHHGPVISWASSTGG